jgi:hypothetical protein
MKRISVDQIQIFKKYGGDSDGFARIAIPSEKRIMEDDVRSKIDALIASLALVEKGLAAPEFEKETLSLLRDSTKDVEAADALRRLASPYSKPRPG